MTDPSTVLSQLSAALADRYTVDRELGRGGMATVYLAQDLKHHRRVAIKVLRPELFAALGTERFQREIEISANLHHPHILALFDSGEAGGLLYYVMPFVEGESLRDRLRRERQLPIDDALQITREVADALEYAHGRGVVHRDIKPENILLENGHALVADFGIARAISAAGVETLTQPGLAVGTVQYMSPEQAAGEKDVDGRSDLYALGCVLYEMLAGEPPHTGPTPQAIMARRLTEPVRPLRVVRESVPAAVEQAVDRALARVPADRFRTTGQFVKALVLPSAPTPAPVSPIRRRALLIAGAAAVLAVGLLAFRGLWSTPLNLTTTNALPTTSSPGVEFQPSLSPDGKQVVFVTRGRLAVSRTMSIGGSGELQPTERLPGQQQYPTWSEDGELIRFWSCAPECAWREVGRLGGPARLVDLPRQAPVTAWSRDGASVAFAEGDSIFVYTVKDRSTRLVAVHPSSLPDVHSLEWSPDGRRIAYVSGNPGWPDVMNISSSSIWVVTLDGKRAAVTSGAGLNVSPAWLDARTLLFVSDRQGPREIYAVEMGSAGPRGDPYKVPGGTDAHSITVSADGSRLAFAKYEVHQQVWAYPIGRAQPLSIRDGQPVTKGTQVVETHDVSRDGQWLVFDSNLGSGGGGARIYKLRLDGGEPALVVASGGGPRWSPDGREIAFQDGSDWVVSAEGGTPTQVTHPPDSSYDNTAFWSPDGLHLMFWSNRTGRVETWLVSRERVGGPWGRESQLTDFGCAGSDWAPDGTGVLCRVRGNREIAMVSLAGAVLWRKNMAAAGFYDMPVYAPDGTSLYMVKSEGERSGIWSWPLAGGEPRLLVSYDDPSLRALTFRGMVTVTRSRLYVTVNQSESDIWVMDLQR